MDLWKWAFVGIFWCAALILRIDAVGLGRSQPTERISGGFSIINVIIC
uniref:Putative beta-1 4-xylosyltransferase IRX10L n=1 Tax=Rhizophora mucronata TaxID=61149 RepID=A0A2P2LF24_RHIMU